MKKHFPASVLAVAMFATVMAMSGCCLTGRAKPGVPPCPEFDAARHDWSRCGTDELVRRLDQDISRAVISTSFVPEESYRTEWAARASGWRAATATLARRARDEERRPLEAAATTLGQVLANVDGERSRDLFVSQGTLRTRLDALKQAVGL